MSSITDSVALAVKEGAKPVQMPRFGLGVYESEGVHTPNGDYELCPLESKGITPCLMMPSRFRRRPGLLQLGPLGTAGGSEGSKTLAILQSGCADLLFA